MLFRRVGGEIIVRPGFFGIRGNEAAFMFQLGNRLTTIEILKHRSR